jgi:hypothetical protein
MSQLTGTEGPEVPVARRLRGAPVCVALVRRPPPPRLVARRRAKAPARAVTNDGTVLSPTTVVDP